MIRRFLASVSTLALLAGLVAAPHTHLHATGRAVGTDPSHAHGHAVVHSHVTSHEADHDHEAPADTDPRDGFSVDAFVFAQVKVHALTDIVVVLPQASAPPRMAAVRTSISPQTPPDHGSPPLLPSSPRAPPVALRAI